MFFEKANEKAIVLQNAEIDISKLKNKSMSINTVACTKIKRQRNCKTILKNRIPTIKRIFIGKR